MARARRAGPGRAALGRGRRRAPLRRASSSDRVRDATRKAEGVADFDDLLIWARDLVRDDPRSAHYFQRPLRRDPDRRVPGHRPDPGRDRDVPRERRPGRRRLARARASARQALRRRRSEAVDLPLPPRRHRHLRRGQARDARGRRPRRSSRTSARSPGDRLGERGLRPRCSIERPGLQPANVPLEPSAPRSSATTADRRRPRTRAATTCRADELREREALSVAAVLRDAVGGAEPWLVRDDERPASCGRRRWRRRRDPAPRADRPRGTTRRRSRPRASPTATRAAATTSSARRSATSSSCWRRSTIPRDRSASSAPCARARSAARTRTSSSTAANGGHSTIASSSTSERRRGDGGIRTCSAVWHRASRGLSVGELASSASSTESRLVEFALTLPDGAQAAANLLAIADAHASSPPQAAAGREHSPAGWARTPSARRTRSTPGSPRRPTTSSG